MTAMNHTTPLAKGIDHQGGLRPATAGAWLALASLLASTAAMADAAAAAGSDDGTLEQIVVTAQKRSENLQDVPIAITALQAKDLQADGIADTSDLKVATPGLQFNTALAGFGQPRIRGVGTTATGPGIENPVATYIDGVYIGSATGTLFALNDVDQVAVLKGPQGTLFGRNATGGLIQVTTKAPTQVATGDVQATYGNYGTIGGSGFLSGGLAPTLAGSIALVYDDQRDGFGQNVLTGHDVQAHRDLGSRAKLLWTPGEATSIMLSGDYSTLTGSEPAIRDISTNIFGGTMGGGDRDIASDIDPYLKTSQWGLGLRAQQGFDGFQLLSITAYREAHFRVRFDADQTPADLLTLDQWQDDRQFSQELQLLSTGKGPFQWVAGAFYFNSSGSYDPVITSGGFLPGPQTLDTTQKLESWALFGQGTYAVSPATNLTAGLRYTSDKRHITASETIVIGGNPIPAQAPVDESKTFDKPTWRLSLDHRFNADLLGYVSYNRGFKSGSFAPQSFPATVLQPEVLDAYETGLKADLLDRRLRVNAAAFYYDYQNIQVNQIQNGLLVVYNGKGAHSYGLDTDLEARVTNHFTLTAGAALIHARYTSFPTAFQTTPITPSFPPPAPPPAPNGGNAVGTGDASGNELQNTPSFTANAGLVYEIPSSVGTFAIAGNYYYNGGYYTAPENRLKQDSYDILDASIGWTSTGGHYSARLWSRNLTNSLYSEQLDAVNFGDNRVAAPPRTVGVTFGAHF